MHCCLGLTFPPAADVVDLKREHQRALLARTLYGHVQNLLGYVRSLYCVYRCGGGPGGKERWTGRAG